jgi:UDP-GlcNAc:undecaprenyl-phosphate/decaprenyl-phosphate GlcNAc-1-phosphate transferase
MIPVNIVILSTTSFFLTLFSILALRPIAIKFGLTDKPCSRKRHQGHIPLIGGLAIYIGILPIGFISEWVTGVGLKGYAGFVAAATVLMIVGVIDDYRSLGVKVRFAAQIFAVMILIKFSGVDIANLGNLLGFGQVNLGSFSTLLTFIAIIGGINAFNMLDGINGLAGGVALVPLVILASIYGSTQNWQSFVICTVFIMTLIVFLFFNFRFHGRSKQLIFLGDAGSTLIGFTVCWLVIYSAQSENSIIKPVTVLWLIAIPILDTVSIMLRRIYKGRSPFAPDREHFHHILPLAGYSSKQTCAIIILSAIFLAMVGMLGDSINGIPEWVMFYLFLFMFALYFIGMNNAWKVMKILRHLKESGNDRRIDERRKVAEPWLEEERRVYGERRRVEDRRFKANEKEIQAVKNWTSKISKSHSLIKIPPKNDGSKDKSD